MKVASAAFFVAILEILQKVSIFVQNFELCPKLSSTS